MRLSDLSPEFLKIIDPTGFKITEGPTIPVDTDGLLFKCPTCFKNNNFSDIGVHSIICWKPHVPQTIDPIPGRWDIVGTTIEDLSLVAGSSSVFLTGEKGCQAHFFITNGEIIGA